MNGADWQDIEDVLAAVIELQTTERSARIAELCGDRAALRAEVESLLTAHEKAASFLEVDTQIESEAAPLFSIDGKQLGPYRLLAILGTGGMGSVYRAERSDGRFEKQVAIKVVPAALHSAELLRRFTNEQQILAALEHPNIARLIDAGVSSEDIPYFVMEHVEGTPVTEFCDAHELSTRERLELFQTLCSAVQYAHQHLVVHRDLKPANILVTADGVPKLLDFGIAKITDPWSTGNLEVTRSLLNPMTPAYASPEQVRGQVLTIATDIYSLGVLLYELLTGQLPYQVIGKSLEEAIRLISEVEPDKPTAVARRHTPGGQGAPRPMLEFSSDLDVIVAKAMCKDRQQRYHSAEDLSADLTRYLDGLPVLAQRSSFRYRASKFTRRHRVGVAVATAALVLLVGFTTTMTVQARRIARERDRANREAESSRRVAEFITNMFKVSDPSEARGKSVTAREILDKASTDINTGLARDPELQAQMMDVIGDVYRNLGLYSRAHPLLQISADTRRRLFGPTNSETLKSMNDLAVTLDEEGQYAEAEKLQRETLDTRRRVLGPNNLDTFTSMTELSLILRQEGRYPEAERLQREVLDSYQRLLGPNDSHTLNGTDQLATTLTEVGQYPEAEKLRRETLDKYRRILGPDHPRTLMSLSNLAGTLEHEGKYPEAEELYRETLDDHRRIFGPEHPRTIGVMDDLAEALSHQRKFAEAENLRRETLALYRRVLGPEHPDTLISMANLAETYALEGRPAEAEKLYQKTLEVQRRLLGPDNPDTATTTYDLAFVAIRRGDRERAFRLFREALDHGLPPEYSMTIEADPELISLHGDPRFERLVARAKELAAVGQGKR
jgi:serine/threonine protein kinase